MKVVRSKPLQDYFRAFLFISQMEYYKNLDLKDISYINEEGLECIEEFRDIPEYEGLYQVSDLGRVKSLSRIILKRNKQPYKTKDLILKPSIGRGYLHINLCKESSKKTKKIHQLVAITFLNHKPCGLKLVVNHINFIKTDNRVENLEIVTSRKNSNRKHLKSMSGFTGVSWNATVNKWKSQIMINGKLTHIGYFETAEEASEYYENAVQAVEAGTEIKFKKKVKSSKYKGVYWSNKLEKWVVTIIVQGAHIHLGTFDDELEASQYYKNALIAIENDEEIEIKKRVTLSKYKGVTCNKYNRWIATVKSKYLGSFKTEEEAHQAILDYKNKLIKNEDTY